MAINDQPTAQKMLPANAHMLRNWLSMRNPAITGATICAIAIKDCIKPRTVP